MVSSDTWTALLAPIPVKDRAALHAFARCARRLASTALNGAADDPIAAIRSQEVGHASALPSDIAPAVILCVNVLCDLRSQGWLIRVDETGVAVLMPARAQISVTEEKARVRAAHLLERNVQLDQPSVRRFLQDMERRRLWGGVWQSVFSLMRDGKDLADQLERALEKRGPEHVAALRKLIDPYLQVISGEAACQFTGLRLRDIWRYFRHTWTTAYQSTPGRSIWFLVRDRAAPNHPVIGIGALGSAIVQLSVRDRWIGWTAKEFIDHVRAKPTTQWARWLSDSLTALINNVYVEDFLAQRVVSAREIARPNKEVIDRLGALAAVERATHRLYPARGLHKSVTAKGGEVDWVQQATTHLFRSKRALALRDLLDARRRLLAAGLTAASKAALQQALGNHDGQRALATILRYTRAAHAGVDMMDITVCGAIAPYNHLLGGKLVSMLMASPDVVAAYNTRYRRASSVIASSVAGRAIRRTPHLVLLGTTSLYGVGASQYNRIRLPASALGGETGEELAFVPLGQTVGYGSYHFSRATMDALDVVLRREQRGRPVNSIFGEGVNPKLRKVRSALNAIGLPADALLQHGTPRLVYGIPLASNFRAVLLGCARRPRYYLPRTGNTTSLIGTYWCERWLTGRIQNAAIVEQVRRHSLVYPILHGARVQLAPMADDGPLFSGTPAVVRETAATN